ncbi:MAG: hypothetical protein SCG77_05080, partial [Nitrosomonadaceae bacterium]|nr:hypothetical protein [Nitrosomonadaceae bacterium]MDW7647510.1 hypothetical protein [Nitrosomonadaceae bacterium]
PHTFLRISSFGSPVALPFVSFGTPSGHYDDRTDVALQNRTDHELSTQPDPILDDEDSVRYYPNDRICD